jgi:hypothetical protein
MALDLHAFNYATVTPGSIEVVEPASAYPRFGASRTSTFARVGSSLRRQFACVWFLSLAPVTFRQLVVWPNANSSLKRFKRAITRQRQGIRSYSMTFRYPD